MITIEELLGRKAAGVDRPEDYIAWAVEQLMAGAESDNLLLLASMDFEQPVDHTEVLQYFFACVRERGIEIPPDNAALRTYAEVLCREITDDKLGAREGLAQLSRLYAASDYSEVLYSIWDALEDDVSSLLVNHQPIFNSGLSKTNINDFIKAVAIQFLALTRVQLPANFFRLAHCTTCGFLGEINNRPLDVRWIPDSLYRFLFRRGRTVEQVCRSCGGNLLLHMHDYAGRERFLQTRAGRRT